VEEKEHKQRRRRRKGKGITRPRQRGEERRDGVPLKKGEHVNCTEKWRLKKSSGRKRDGYSYRENKGTNTNSWKKRGYLKGKDSQG